MLTYRGVLAPGTQKKIHLSTNDGLTGYRLKEFSLMSVTPGAVANVTFIGQVHTTDQATTIEPTVNLGDPSLIGVNYYQDHQNAGYYAQQIILDSETINQDVYIYVVDPDGGTVSCNYYIAFEKFKIGLNESTATTLKNIRQSAADRL